MKKATLAALALILTLPLTACSTAPKPVERDSAPPTIASSADPLAVSVQKPMVMDETSKTIRILAKVNGKYLVESTRHGLNFEGGKNGPKALFYTTVKETDFYDALLKLGAVPGNNLTANSKGETIQGHDLGVTVTWEGAKQDYAIDEVVADSTGKPIKYKFGGNLEAAKEYVTGCMLCLDSCPVGIASNASHAYGEHDAKQVQFKGKADLLPGDGQVVIISVKVQ